MKIFMLFIMFLFIGAFFIISNNNLALNSTENTKTFFELYGKWFDSLVDNGGSLVGYVIDMRWLPNPKESS